MSIILFKNATLIDGTGAKPVEHSAIAIEDDKIIFTGSMENWHVPEGKSVQEFDMTGRTILPGLIDCHVHIAAECLPDSTMNGPWGWTTLIMLKHAQNTLSAGITTIRDVGGRHHLEFSLRKAVEAGLFVAPRMSLAGKLLSITCAGSEWYDGMYREADGVEEVRKAAREQLKAGADLIKVLATGAVLSPGEKPGAATFELEEIRAAVVEAQKVGKIVAAHAHGIEGIRNAVEAGAKTIEHGTYLSQDPLVMERMAKENIFLVPTLKAGYDVIYGDRPGIPQWIMEKSKETQEDAMRSIRKAYEMGVPIAMGTDAATPYNFHGENAMELYYMSQAGISTMDCIVASTKNAAKALGWDSRIGTLEAGKLADLLIVKKNPLDDLRSLADRTNIEYVMQNGKFVARQYSDASGIPEELMAGAWICCGF
ncbi:MAG TPA: amidohydrolase family protein [Anaerolineales bacterium]|nr:amidohydrolase family protein [Anaerolineales bacterium]HNA89811.1 amidohydrolase family protein [Anaerolineales bacterium]HNB35985.1 amidohydrolase family protein [Anaerolineales bacterium]HNC08962.1 amidohydrolase family protein [Anaerolineales bacterium]